MVAINISTSLGVYLMKSSLVLSSITALLLTTTVWAGTAINCNGNICTKSEGPGASVVSNNCVEGHTCTQYNTLTNGNGNLAGKNQTNCPLIEGLQLQTEMQSGLVIGLENVSQPQIINPPRCR